MGVFLYSTALALIAGLTSVSGTLMDLPDLSLAKDNDLLSALSWVTLDFNHLSHDPDYGFLTTSFEGFNTSTVGSRSLSHGKTRRKRSLSFELNHDIFVDLEFRFKIPLFEVYESTFFMFEVPMNYKTYLFHAGEDNARSWMEGLPTALNELEEVVSLLGVDGEACVKRTFCELASGPSLQPEGLVGEMIRVFVNYLAKSSPEETNEVETRSFTNEYIQAGLKGRQNGRCWEAYPDCPLSLLNLLSDYQK